MIEVRNLGYTINNKTILDNINLNIKVGQITAILGPNGAGKSTLLKCLTGTISPQRGEVMLDGKPIESYSLQSLSRRRAILSQSNPITFPFTALEIVLMGRNPYIDRNETEADLDIVCQTLKSVDAWKLKDQSYPTLSGGEQQRVQIARVLAQIWNQENSFLFLDEPTSSLDLKHQYQLLELIQQLCKTHHLTVVIIMHDINLAYYFTDNTIFIKNGQTLMAGATSNIVNAKNISEFYNLPKKYALTHFPFEEEKSNYYN